MCDLAPIGGSNCGLQEVIALLFGETAFTGGLYLCGGPRPRLVPPIPYGPSSNNATRK
jgi:hypothetical protein